MKAPRTLQQFNDHPWVDKAFRDDDGYWVWLKPQFWSSNMECGTLREDTVKELVEQWQYVEPRVVKTDDGFDFPVLSEQELLPAQRSAVLRFLKNCIDDVIDRHREYDPVLHMRINAISCGRISVTAHVDLEGLGEGNLLRFIVSGERWHLFIGPRGGVEAVSYPKSIEQFKGRQFMGINIR